MRNINVYDYDGVLADPIEDTVFRLEVNPNDTEFIALGRERYGITRLSDHVQRNRHLILQEVLYERKICPTPGPTFMNLNGDPFYVLTARSGPGAVARVSQFFEAHNHRPEELFFVGPMSKDHLLIDLCEKFSDRQLTFYDDSHHHIEAAQALGFENLNVVWIDNKVDTLFEDAKIFYEAQVNWLSEQPN